MKFLFLICRICVILIGGYTTTHCKMTDYASQTQDPEVKKLFQDAANSAMQNKQELMRFL